MQKFNISFSQRELDYILMLLDMEKFKFSVLNEDKKKKKEVAKYNQLVNELHQSLEAHKDVAST
jgi:hypothetical protein